MNHNQDQLYTKALEIANGYLLLTETGLNWDDYEDKVSLWPYLEVDMNDEQLKEAVYYAVIDRIKESSLGSEKARRESIHKIILGNQDLKSKKFTYTSEDELVIIKPTTKPKEFSKKLLSILKENERPFICKGSPLDCKIFIVGINPASQSNNFTKFWNENKGFRYEEWFQGYKAFNKMKVKPEISKTRNRIIEITKILEANGSKVLETNVYPKEAARYKDLKKEDKNPEIFKFLIETIKPDLIHLHGNKAIKAFEKLYQISTNQAQINIAEKTILISTSQHFSYQFSKVKAEETALKIVENFKQKKHF